MISFVDLWLDLRINWAVSFFDPKDFKDIGEKLQQAAQGEQAIRQSRQQFTENVRGALRAAIGLPEQIDRLAGEVGKLVEVASAQKLLAEEAVKQSENLSRQTDRLVSQIAALIIITEEQKNFAAKLERQTDKLISLTRTLVFFSAVLFVVALIQIIIILK